MSLGSVSVPHQVHHFKGDVFVVRVLSPNARRSRAQNLSTTDICMGELCVIGRRTSIGDGARIENSVIGDLVSVGKGALIENSIISNNTSIGENVAIENSIVSENCIVRRGAKIPPKCFLDSDVIIDTDFQGNRSCSLLSTLPDSAFTP